MLTNNFHKCAIWYATAAPMTGKEDGFSLIRTDGVQVYPSSANYVETCRFGGTAQFAGSIKRVMSTLLTSHSYSSAPSSSTGSGIVFGNGTTPVTVDDYSLSGDIFTTFTSTISTTLTTEEDGFAITSMVTLTNTGSEAFTISEVALYGWTYGYTSKTSSNIVSCRIMTERTLLDKPITIEAGGVGIVTYTIRMNYPTT